MTDTKRARKLALEEWGITERGEARHLLTALADEVDELRETLKNNVALNEHWVETKWKPLLAAVKARFGNIGPHDIKASEIERTLAARIAACEEKP